MNSRSLVLHAVLVAFLVPTALVAIFSAIPINYWFYSTLINGILYPICIGLAFSFVWFILIWLWSPSLIENLFDIKWLTRSDDPVLYNLAIGEAEKLEISLNGIGIIENQIPNAYIYTGVDLKPKIVYTRGLLITLKYPETRAVTLYLLGLAATGTLPFITRFTGRLILSQRFMENKLKAQTLGVKPSFTSQLTSLMGGLWARITYWISLPIVLEASNQANAHEFRASRDSSIPLSTLIKVSSGICKNKTDMFRWRGAALKYLTYLDPGIVSREADMSKAVLERTGIDHVASLREYIHGLSNYPSNSMEQINSQVTLSERIDNILQKSNRPIKIGLTWIK